MDLPGSRLSQCLSSKVRPRPRNSTVFIRLREANSPRSLPVRNDCGLGPKDHCILLLSQQRALKLENDLRTVMMRTLIVHNQNFRHIESSV